MVDPMTILGSVVLPLCLVLTRNLCAGRLNVLPIVQSLLCAGCC